MNRTSMITTIGVAMVWTLASSAHASPQLLSQAKSAGIPVKNCQSCHVSALPKKDTFKPEDLNMRGKWLVAEQAKTKAPAINVEWLKNYSGAE